MRRDNGILELAKLFFDDADTNVEYWWNRPKCKKGECRNRALSFRDRCWYHLTEDERKAYRVDILRRKYGYNGLSGLNLEGIYLKKADLQGVELSYANLEEADLSFANLEEADSWELNLSDAKLCGANLIGAHLGFAKLVGADLWNVKLEGADLFFANLKGTNLYHAQVGRRGLVWERKVEKQADKNARLKFEESTSFLNVKYNPNTNFLFPFARIIWGVHYIWCIIRRKKLPKRLFYTQFKKTILLRLNTTDLDWSKHPQLIRDIHYQQFLDAFKNKSKLHRRILHPLWGITSFFGERISLWLFWAGVIILLFAAVFCYTDCCFYLPPDPLQGSEVLSFTDGVYLSGLTFTSLGLGSYEPANSLAKWLILAEVMLGFIMLGSLVSFFANKFVRRD